MIEEKREYTIEVFESKVSDSEFARSEQVSCENIKVEVVTLHELLAPNLETQPLSITYPVLDRLLKLNSGFLNFLLKFNGLHGEDPYRHINEFIITCSTMQPEGIIQDQIRSMTFPFSLQDKAKTRYITCPLRHSLPGLKFIKHFQRNFFPQLELGPLERKYVGLNK